MQIKAIYNWPKSQLVYNIHVFLGFANFYQKFFQKFSKFAVSLTSILKIISIVGLGDENPKLSDKKILVKDWDKKELIQKNCKSQKTAKSKK